MSSIQMESIERLKEKTHKAKAQRLPQAADEEKE
jgi:hypothetical protein